MLTHNFLQYARWQLMMMSFWTMAGIISQHSCFVLQMMILKKLFHIIGTVIYIVLHVHISIYSVPTVHMSPAYMKQKTWSSKLEVTGVTNFIKIVRLMRLSWLFNYYCNSIKIVYNSNSDTTLWLISLLSLFQMHLHVTYQGLAAAATDSNRSVPSIHGKKLGLSYNPFHG